MTRLRVILEVAPNEEEQHLQGVQCDFSVVFQGGSNVLELFAEEGALLFNFEVAQEGWVDLPEELLDVKLIVFPSATGIGRTSWALSSPI